MARNKRDLNEVKRLREEGKKLVDKLQSNGMTRIQIADSLEMAPGTLRSKYAGSNPFFQNEIDSMKDILKNARS